MHGDWYIALVDEGTAFDPTVHNRRDLPAKVIRISETEDAGQARVSFTLNQTVSALNQPGRKTWMHLSRELADGSLKHIAYGHQIALPVRGNAEGGLPIVDYDCSPTDWQTPEAAATAPLAVLPFFDVTLCEKSRRTDAKEILDGRFAVVHCDRASHAFTCPTKFGTELATFAITRAWGPPTDEPPQSRVVDAPVGAVVIDVTVEFVQAGDDFIDMSDTIKNAFPSGYVETLTPDQLEKGWIKQGAKLNGNSGYTFVVSTLTRLTDAQVDAIVPSVETTAGPFHSAPEKQHYATYYSYVNDRSQAVPYTLETADGRSIKRYSYVDQTKNAADPAGLLSSTATVPRCYYDVTVKVAWTLRQKRVETIRYVLKNGGQQIAPGAIRYLSLRLQDVTDDSSMLQWAPLTPYAVGDIRRVGLSVWECLVAHKSGSYWEQDQTLTQANGTKATLWQQLPGDQSPLQNRALASYFLTARGLETWQAILLKGRRIMADSMRGEVRARTFLTDDLLDLTTAAQATITAPRDLLEAGSVTGKVGSVELYSEPGAGIEYLDMTIRPGLGSGLAPTLAPTDVDGNPVADPGQYVTVNATGHDWDLITTGGLPFAASQAFPLITAVAAAVNKSDDQMAFVQANDFVLNDPVRGDDKAADPDALLAKVPTGVQVAATQLSGRPPMVANFLPVVMGCWSGPKQLDTGAA